MSKYKTVCKMISENADEISRKDLVAKIAKETGYNPTTVNVYYSKYLNESKEKSSKEKISNGAEKTSDEFKRTTKIYTKKGHEITVDKQMSFLTAVTVKNLKTGMDATTTNNGSEESINKSIEELKYRLAIGDAKPDMPKKVKK